MKGLPIPTADELVEAARALDEVSQQHAAFSAERRSLDTVVQWLRYVAAHADAAAKIMQRARRRRA